MTQADRILAALKDGPKTSWELQQLGICSHTARVSDLRKRGFEIQAVERWRGRQKIVWYYLKEQQELFKDVA